MAKKQARFSAVRYCYTVGCHMQQSQLQNQLTFLAADTAVVLLSRLLPCALFVRCDLDLKGSETVTYFGFHAQLLCQLNNCSVDWAFLPISQAAFCCYKRRNSIEEYQ